MARPKLVITKEMIKKTEQYAAQGLTLEQIAHCLGIHVATLYAKKKQCDELTEAIKKGKASGIQEVTNKLYEKAMNGDNTAMIFFLKCRDRENWSEQKAESGGAAEIAEALSSIADNLPK